MMEWTEAHRKLDNINYSAADTEIMVSVKWLKELLDEAEDYYKRSIAWGIDDFIHQAQFHKDQYDESKFQEALERMISKHDANIGITWDTIDIYLDKYCLKT